MTPEEKLVKKLIEKGWHISCAESCTGGMLSSRIVNVADASRVLEASFVTYAEAAKINYVQVSPDTIQKYGVVSEAVAAEMAEGAALAAGAEVGIGISGIAGPGGGTKEKPVGTVCFGFYVNGAITTAAMQFPDIGRNRVREMSTAYALEAVVQLI